MRALVQLLLHSELNLQDNVLCPWYHQLLLVLCLYKPILSSHSYHPLGLNYSLFSKNILWTLLFLPLCLTAFLIYIIFHSQLSNFLSILQNPARNHLLTTALSGSQLPHNSSAHGSDHVALTPALLTKGVWNQLTEWREEWRNGDWQWHHCDWFIVMIEGRK
jgi:hypothetical protein